jgi:hypothetical protein
VKERAGGKGLCSRYIFVAEMTEVICQGDLLKFECFYAAFSVVAATDVLIVQG